MQRYRNQKQSNTKTSAGLIPISLDNGTRGYIALDNLPNDKWTKHHGIASDGTQVNSIESVMVGDSYLIRSSRKSPVISVTKRELEVFLASIANDFDLTKTQVNTTK